MTAAYGTIAISGGIRVQPVLGSCATDVRAQFGGHRGRPLIAGDLLETGLENTRIGIRENWHVAWPSAPLDVEIRCLKGMQYHWFTHASQNHFESLPYRKSGFSDRTGARLAGPALERADDRQMTSQPVVAGSIQVPPDGQPIVLMPECQTIGGYPQIAHVISADLALLSRTLPNTVIHFRMVSLEEARQAWLDLKRDQAMVKVGISLCR